MTTHKHAKQAGTPAWIDLITPNIDAARDFYQALFGWEYDIGGAEYGGYTTARLGALPVAGFMGQQPDSPQEPSAWGLYFATDKIEADVARAEQMGAKVVYPAMAVGEFGHMAVCTDPTGALFSFWQAGQHIGLEAINVPGAPAWFELYSPQAQQASMFYTELFGLSAEPMPGDMEYYVLTRGEDQLAGIMQIDPSWGTLHPQWITYFAVADADETLALTTKHGGRAMSGIDDSPFGRLAALMDPNGALFKIVEIPAR